MSDSHWRPVDGAPDPFRVRWFESVDSTNRYLLDGARSGEPEGLVAVADVQTAGRGRLGRRWETDPGAALLASILLRPTSNLDPHLLTTTVALALRRAVERLTGTAPGLKWPNDLVVADRKLAGVLAEAIPTPQGTAIVVGAGTNVKAVPSEFRDRAIACDDLADGSVDRQQLLFAWLEELAARVRRPGEVIDEATVASATLGRDVRIEGHDGEAITGRAVGLTASGALVVEMEDGSRRAFTAGDVVHLRPA